MSRDLCVEVSRVLTLVVNTNGGLAAATLGNTLTRAGPVKIIVNSLVPFLPYPTNHPPMRLFSGFLV